MQRASVVSGYDVLLPPQNGSKTNTCFSSKINVSCNNSILYLFVYPSISTVSPLRMEESGQVVNSSNFFFFNCNKDIIETYKFQYSVIDLQSILQNVKSEFKTSLQTYLKKKTSKDPKWENLSKG